MTQTPKDHNFRGKPLTLDEFGAELARGVRLAKMSRAWEELPWSVRLWFDGIESKYQQMVEGLNTAAQNNAKEPAAKL